MEEQVTKTIEGATAAVSEPQKQSAITIDQVATVMNKQAELLQQIVVAHNNLVDKTDVKVKNNETEFSAFKTSVLNQLGKINELLAEQHDALKKVRKKTIKLGKVVGTSSKKHHKDKKSKK